MTTIEINALYLSGINQLIKELDQFTSDEDVWKTVPGINNSCGNLTLHLIGNMNFFIGSTLLGGTYQRDRDAEFSTKGLTREELKKQLTETANMLNEGFPKLTSEALSQPFPFEFAGKQTALFYVLMFLGHCQYHLGQMTYLRRMLAHS